jgi:sporulation protein YlmC with PRC-barrel domain
MGTQVITRDTGRRLGVVGEVVVDIDRREVVALGLRDNPLTRFLPGLPRWMPLESIRQVGDVILVDSADSLSEAFNPERYSKVINCQVITESGEQLGRVLGFSFDIETGELTTLVIGALGVPLLGEGVLSTWELGVGEIVSSGTDRIIVYEGAEEKLKQLGTGLLEKLGIGGSSWEREERERFRGGVIPAENQLPAGQPSSLEQRRIQPATSRAVAPERELDYLELEDRREREPLRQRLYLDDEDLSRREPARRERYADDDQESGIRDRWSDGNEGYPRRGPGPGDRDVPERFGRDRADAEDLRGSRIEPDPYDTGRPSLDRGAGDRSSSRREGEREPLSLQGERSGRRSSEPDNPVARPINPQERGPSDPGADPWAEPRPRGAQRPSIEREPIDVEPEVLNDPW